MSSEELLWSGLPRRSGTGPKPTLSRDMIIRTALEIADAEGLDALSMQRLAQDLGRSTMGLYRHVPGKNELVSLMLDAAIGQPPELDTTTLRTTLETWARGSREMFRQHPWALSQVGMARVMGPNETAWVEAALRATSEAGLSATSGLDVIVAVNSYVRGAAAIDVAAARLPSRDALLQFVGQDRYPTIVSFMNSGGFVRPATASGPHRGFEFGLGLVLDGIGLFIQGES